MATFLSVLKIIGIVLLVILAVILVLLLLVLFVPIMYRVDATVPETELDNGFDKDKVNASAKFSWLLFVIRGGIEFPRDKTFTLKVCGITILPRKEKSEKEDASGKEDTSGKEDAGENAVTEAATEEKTEEKAEEKTEEKPVESEPAATEEADASDKEEEKTESDSAAANTESAPSGEEDENEPKSFLDVLWKIIDTVDNILKTPLDVLEKIRCTISRVCDKIEMIRSSLENDIFKRAFALVKKMLVRVLKMVLPDKCDIKLLFGAGDPATTAEIMGAYGALYPVLYKKVEFTPDFERKVVGADVHIKGHITVFTVVYCAAVCFFNKDVRKTINRFKKIVNS